MSITIINDASFGAEVLESDKPVLLDFFAEWCGPCKMLTPVLEELAGEYSGKVKFCKIDTDVSPVTAQRYGVQSIPNVLIFKNGEPQARIVGFSDRNKMKAFIDSCLE